MSGSSPTCSRMYVTFGDEGGEILKWVVTRFTNLGYGIAVGLLGAARLQMRLYVAAPQQLRRIICYFALLPYHWPRSNNNNYGK